MELCGEESLVVVKNRQIHDTSAMIFLNTFRACPAKMIKPVLIMKRLTYCRAHVSAYIFLPVSQKNKEALIIAYSTIRQVPITLVKVQHLKVVEVKHY